MEGHSQEHSGKKQQFDIKGSHTTNLPCSARPPGKRKRTD